MDAVQEAYDIWKIILIFAPVAISLAAVIVGPVVALKVAKRQIRASLVSANRVKWIDALRNDSAEFLVSITNTIATWERGGAEASDNLQKAFLAGTRIKLRLNILNQDENRLSEVIQAFVQDPKIASEKLGELGDRFDSLLRPILKREQEKVERGE